LTVFAKDEYTAPVMENTSQPIENNQQPMPERTQVSFPEPKKTKKSPLGIIVIITVIFLLVGAIVFAYANKDSIPFLAGTPSPTPTPITVKISPTETPPTPTVVEIKRDNLSIAVLNGTGTPGEAGVAAKLIEKLGYTTVTTGNASSQTFTKTEIIYKSTVGQANIDEIKSELEKSYQEVTVKTGTPGKGDIQVTIGFKKGQTATPTTTIKPSTLTPTKAATVSGTLTPTKTPTPTVQ
jgi:LytR cell envelope-related transcriptional attenuator